MPEKEIRMPESLEERLSLIKDNLDNLKDQVRKLREKRKASHNPKMKKPCIYVAKVFATRKLLGKFEDGKPKYAPYFTPEIKIEPVTAEGCHVQSRYIDMIMRFGGFIIDYDLPTFDDLKRKARREKNKDTYSGTSALLELEPEDNPYAGLINRCQREMNIIRSWEKDKVYAQKDEKLNAMEKKVKELQAKIKKQSQQDVSSSSARVINN